VVKLDVLANDAGLAAILLLPEKIAEHSNRAGVAARSVGGAELAAEEGRYSHVGEEIGGVAANIDRDGEAVAGERLPGVVHQEDVVDGGKLLKVFEFGGGDGKKAAVGRRLVAELDMDHAVGVLVGVGIEQDGADHAEDGYACPDTECQGADGHQGKAGRLPELPEAESEILQQDGEEG